MTDVPFNQSSDIDFENFDFASVPDARGHFGRYGGRFVSETLISALDELAAAYGKLKDDAAFMAEFDTDLAHYRGVLRQCTTLSAGVSRSVARKFI